MFFLVWIGRFKYSTTRPCGHSSSNGEPTCRDAGIEGFTKGEVLWYAGQAHQPVAVSPKAPEAQGLPGAWKHGLLIIERFIAGIES